MHFEFATAARIIFGDGSAAQLPQLARELGGHALLVTDSFQPDAVAQLIDSLRDAELDLTHFPVSGEPSVEVIDAAKAIATVRGLRYRDQHRWRQCYRQRQSQRRAHPQPGRGSRLSGSHRRRARKLSADPLPFIALPTTAGTGAEVSKNAVLGSKAHRVKVSLRDNRMLADIALVDPLLTHSLPPAVTASTGMDALTQVLEPFVSHLATPLTDGMCSEGLRRAGRSLRRVYEQPDDAAARRDMALVSLLGGLALANAKLGAVHGFAGVLGGMYDAPHGAVCAALLPPVMAANIKALQANANPRTPPCMRYEYAAQFLLFDRSATAQDAMDWIDESSRQFGIPSLSAYGVSAGDFDEIVAKSSASSSMKGNPIALSAVELTEILRAAL